MRFESFSMSKVLCDLVSPWWDSILSVRDRKSLVRYQAEKYWCSMYMLKLLL